MNGVSQGAFPSGTFVCAIEFAIRSEYGLSGARLIQNEADFAFGTRGCRLRGLCRLANPARTKAVGSRITPCVEALNNTYF